MRRRLVTVAIFLLAGAVVNVAVAYACVFWTPTWPGGIHHRLPPGSRWVRDPGAPWPPPNNGLRESAFGNSYISRSSHILSDDDVPISYTQIVDQYGWPLRTVESEVRFVMSRSVQLTLETIGHGGLVSTWPLNSSGPMWRGFPYRPIWPGFAVNTLLYGTLFCLLTCLAIAVRRFLRLRRGLCPKCAYPMGESAVCSECGKELPQRVRAAT